MRALAFSGPAALIVALAWGLGLVPHARPVMVLMVYLALLAVAMVGALAAAAASCHLAIGQAFYAGMRAAEPPAPVEPASRGLRLVE